jgi:hypothetical protein
MANGAGRNRFVCLARAASWRVEGDGGIGIVGEKIYVDC